MNGWGWGGVRMGWWRGWWCGSVGGGGVVVVGGWVVVAVVEVEWGWVGGWVGFQDAKLLLLLSSLVVPFLTEFIV